VLGLNLGLNDPRNPFEFATAALARLPTGSIRSFEIGNEPDLFARPRTFHVGERTLERVRQRQAYDFDQYKSELGPYLEKLQPLGVPLRGGGFAGQLWDPLTQHMLLAHGERMPEIAAHSYALNTCGNLRRLRPRELIVRLLQSRAPLVRIAALDKLVAGQGASLYVSETNTGICGGAAGVSNTFASALWGTNTLFSYLAAGAEGANLHSWKGAWYTPIEFRRTGGAPIAYVRPLFYGMLLFAKATANEGRLVGVRTKGKGVRAWATVDRAGTVRVVLLNFAARAARRAKVTIPGAAQSATLERLTAPQLEARSRIRLGGQTFGKTSTTGRLRGAPTAARIRSAGGRYSFSLPAASGALLAVAPSAPAG
jgi:hypothetical protein